MRKLSIGRRTIRWRFGRIGQGWAARIPDEMWPGRWFEYEDRSLLIRFGYCEYDTLILVVVW